MSEDIISHITSTKNTTAKNIFINATHTYKFSSGALSLHLLALTNFFCKVPYCWKLFYPTYKKKVSHYTQLLCTEKSSVQVNRSIFWHRKSISGYEKLPYAVDKEHQKYPNLRFFILECQISIASMLRPYCSNSSPEIDALFEPC